MRYIADTELGCVVGGDDPIVNLPTNGLSALAFNNPNIVPLAENEYQLVTPGGQAPLTLF